MDGAKRVASERFQSFPWDGADRLVQRGTDTFGYDPLSRLTSATVAGATTTYTYDGDGLLAIRTAAGGSTSFVWDASVAPAPLLEAGTDRVVHGLGPLYLARADGSTIRLVRDALGSVRAELSDLGVVAKAFRYAAYGAIADRAPLDAVPTLLGFTGELADPSGMTYLRARWYDPVSGRFTSRDPFIGNVHRPASLNAYGYAAGRPSLLVDPLGLDPEKSNWAYAIADVFADLDSTDNGTRLTAYAKVVAAGIGAGLVAAAGVAAASAAVGAVSAGHAAAASGGTITLYRAVGAAEASDTMRTGAYRIAGASAEFGKYFYATKGQAERFVASGWATRVTSGVFPRAALENARIDPVLEGLSYFFPLGPVRFY